MKTVVIRMNKRSPYLNKMSERLENTGIETDEINRILNLLEYVETLIGSPVQG